MEQWKKAHDNSISNKIFRSLFETGSDLLGIIDIKGNYSFVSPSCEHILGYTPREFIGRNAFEFIHPEDIPKSLEALNSITGQEIVHLEPFRFLNAKGEWRWIETVATNQLENPVINGIIVNSRDITEKINNRKQLRPLNIIHKNISTKGTLQQQLKKEQENFQKKLSEAVIAAQENERSIISQELHDNVSQLLSTAKLYLDLIQNQEGVENPMLTKTMEIINLSIHEIRDISHALSASLFNENSLKESIELLISQVNEALKIQFTLEIINLDDTILSCELKLTIYRIIQEQVNNIFKHSEAKNAAIWIEQKDTCLFLVISDNGIGFDRDLHQPGIGLNNIRKRVRSCGGKIDLQTNPGTGCILKIEFDLDHGCTETRSN